MLVRAYAKINLGLRILRKRPDGYHDIETMFHRIDISDEISFEMAETITVESSGTEVPNDRTNLCVRAAEALRAATGFSGGVTMRLQKSIPVGAGLGGGSANAAAVLRSLGRFWGVPVASDLRFEIARGLGADVPYFLAPGSAYATGTGDTLAYDDLTLPYAILVVHPGLHVSTPWAYAHCTPRERRGLPTLKEIWQTASQNPEVLRTMIDNDFEPVVYTAHPVIRQLRDVLLDNGAILALLSGSGSSVFGLFPTEESAASAATGLPTSYRSFVTPRFFRMPEEAAT